MPSESRTWEMTEACRIFARDTSTHAVKKVLREAAQAGVISWRETVGELTEAEADRLGRWIDGLMRVQASGDNVTRLTFEIHMNIDRARALLTQAAQPAEALLHVRIALAAGQQLAIVAERIERDTAGAVANA